MFNDKTKRKQMYGKEQRFYKTVGNKLRLLMREKGIRQLDVATEADIAPSTFANYLDGTRRLNMYKLMKILKALPVSTDEIMLLIKDALDSIELVD